MLGESKIQLNKNIDVSMIVDSIFKNIDYEKNDFAPLLIYIHYHINSCTRKKFKCSKCGRTCKEISKSGFPFDQCSCAKQFRLRVVFSISSSIPNSINILLFWTGILRVYNK